jgi:hypothetical protein
MICARVDAAHSVGTSRQATLDLSRQDAILGRRVETFEEHELLWIQRRNRLQRRNCLNAHVAVALNDPVVVNGL